MALGKYSQQVPSHLAHQRVPRLVISKILRTLSDAVIIQFAQMNVISPEVGVTHAAFLVYF